MVTSQWIHDSEQAGWCQEEAAYALPNAGGEGGAQVGGGLLPPPPAAPPVAPPPAAVSLMDEATRLAEPLAAANGPPSRAAPAAGEAAPRPPSRLQRAGSSLQPEAGAADLAAQALVPRGAQQAAAAAHQAVLEAQLEWDDDTPTFLDAVRLRLLGCSPAEGQEALDLVRRSAAKRFADWRDDLHYVVVSERECGSERQCRSERAVVNAGVREAAGAVPPAPAPARAA